VILYDPSQRHSLREFGIDIPVLDSRAAETFARLCAHPVLGPKKPLWHIARIEEDIRREDLLRAHTGDYVARLFSSRLESEIIRTYELIDARGNPFRYRPRDAELPLTALFGRILKRVAGTAQGCRSALEHGFCFYFGGGMHHAQQDHGAGFCLVNDVVIALRKLQAERRIRSAWVIDVDAHKGDGTAAITAGDETIVSLSIHMARGWPLDQPEHDAAGRPNPSFIASDIDLPVAAGEEALYLERLQQGLERLDGFPPPQLALVVCGSDPYALDELPSTAGLRLSLPQLLERDRMVYAFLNARRIPGAWVMAGGYGSNSWRVYTQFLEWALLERLVR
jgi:acetoin utilization deacetylase AcuC-like enzyme